MEFRFDSRRSIVYGANGMVATAQPLAAQAGLEALRRGGNAVDAAVAAASALTVTEPCSNGMGGDAFAIVWKDGTMYGVNSSGRSPRAISAELLRRRGFKTVPNNGPLPVTVPGIPGMWAFLHDRFGALPFAEELSDAIRYAEEGYPVSPVIAKLWKAGLDRFAARRSEGDHEEWFRVFAPEGRAPEAGEIVHLPDHARTLRRIAETGAEAFYRGELSERIADHVRGLGGFLAEEDLAAFHTEPVDPISVEYRGRTIWELPPNGQGIVALLALNILKGFRFTDRTAPETLHRQMEAIKLAFADARHYVTDPACMGVTCRELLSEEYAAERRKLIGHTAADPLFGDPRGSDTVYLCTADAEGNMVSYIQSNYMGFGSGVVVPGTGIALQNRGANFSLEKGHPNELAGGKKTYHTIIPGFITVGGEPLGPFGMMGGFMQPQGHVQMVMDMFDFGLDIQETLNVPRWQWTDGKRFLLERQFGEWTAEALRARGHEIVLSDEHERFGRGEVIFRTGHGSYMGASEPRADGLVAAY